jgi:hypothetical protein
MGLVIRWPGPRSRPDMPSRDDEVQTGQVLLFLGVRYEREPLDGDGPQRPGRGHGAVAPGPERSPRRRRRG